jgi:hypothetical protein
MQKEIARGILLRNCIYTLFDGATSLARVPMKTLLKALIGGVLVQISIFLLLLIGVLINIDKLLPNVAKVLVAIFMLTAPGVIFLVREGEPQANRGFMLATGVIIDTLLYSLVVYVVLLFRRALKNPVSPSA